MFRLVPADANIEKPHRAISQGDLRAWNYRELSFRAEELVLVWASASHAAWQSALALVSSFQ